jgi:hypothetical protein
MTVKLGAVEAPCRRLTRDAKLLESQFLHDAKARSVAPTFRQSPEARRSLSRNSPLLFCSLVTVFRVANRATMHATMELKRLISHFTYRIEPKPEGGFIAHASEPGVPTD